jgi:hypothetical protein
MASVFHCPASVLALPDPPKQCQQDSKRAQPIAFSLSPPHTTPCTHHSHSLARLMHDGALHSRALPTCSPRSTTTQYSCHAHTTPTHSPALMHDGALQSRTAEPFSPALHPGILILTATYHTMLSTPNHSLAVCTTVHCNLAQPCPSHPLSNQHSRSHKTDTAAMYRSHSRSVTHVTQTSSITTLC